MPITAKYDNWNPNWKIFIGFSKIKNVAEAAKELYIGIFLLKSPPKVTKENIVDALKTEEENPVKSA